MKKKNSNINKLNFVKLIKQNYLTTFKHKHSRKLMSSIDENSNAKFHCLVIAIEFVILSMKIAHLKTELTLYNSKFICQKLNIGLKGFINHSYKIQYLNHLVIRH